MYSKESSSLYYATPPNYSPDEEIFAQAVASWQGNQKFALNQ
jgi:hypothetical protein